MRTECGPPIPSEASRPDDDGELDAALRGHRLEGAAGFLENVQRASPLRRYGHPTGLNVREVEDVVSLRPSRVRTSKAPFGSRRAASRSA
jgi:hypothetical protein